MLTSKDLFDLLLLPYYIDNSIQLTPTKIDLRKPSFLSSTSSLAK
jgi:hypothetical protein